MSGPERFRGDLDPKGPGGQNAPFGKIKPMLFVALMGLAIYMLASYLKKSADLPASTPAYIQPHLTNTSQLDAPHQAGH